MTTAEAREARPRCSWCNRKVPRENHRPNCPRPDERYSAFDLAAIRAESAQELAALRGPLALIEARGCDASAAHDEDPLVWDRCRDYEYREDKPTGDPDRDRCDPCIAHAALAATPAEEEERRT